MEAAIISADDRQRAPDAGFRLFEFRRIVRLTWPYRRSLILGLVATVLFAGLHTAGISGAFPVFQILLEEEGLHGWSDRVLAGHRLGVDFAPLVDGAPLRVVRVHKDGALQEAGVQVGDEITHLESTAPLDVFQKTIEATGSITLRAGLRGAYREIEVIPGAPGRWDPLLTWGIGFLPPDDAKTKLRSLTVILLVLASTTVIANVFRFVGESLVAGAVLRAMMDLRDQLYERALQLPMSFFAGTQTADVVTRFVQDIQEIQRGLLTLFGKFIREPMRALFLLAFALTLDWRITLALSIIVPFVMAVFWAVGRSVKKANRKLLQAYGLMIAALTASLQNLRTVKAYTAENQEQDRLDVVDRKMFQQQLRLAKLDAFLSPMMESVAVISGSILTVWLAARVLDARLDIPTFGTLGVALGMLFDPLRKMTDVYVRIQRSTAGAERIFQVIDHPVESDLSQGDVELTMLSDRIEFDGVTFTYPRGAAPALRDVSLSISRGETIALVGPNGSGKTTLTSLLLRLYEPDSGCIRYDGVDLRRAKLASLRKQISVVSQEAVVFAGDPAGNIAYGDGKPDRKRIEHAAAQAFADDFIRELEGGFDAAVGEHGSTLSGGQRQRLAIARAVYRNAPILIFDEATSQVDSESERKIQSALREFARDRTTIIIAHRLSTIQFARRIVVFDAGRIVDSGAHDELLKRCELYRRLCSTQLLSDGVG